MGCKCAKFDGEGRYECAVTGDGCVFLFPNSKACAELYGEGPDANSDVCEDCMAFYLEDDKRCCVEEPLTTNENMEIVNSKYIDDDVVCCGGFKRKDKELKYDSDNTVKFSITKSRFKHDEDVTVWRCANCKYRTVDEKKEPCKSCDGKNNWIYDIRLDNHEEEK